MRKHYARWREHGAPGWLLVYTLGGRGRFGHDRGDLPVRKGDLVLLLPKVRNDYGLEETLKRWDLLWAYFFPRSEWLALLNWPEEAPGLLRLHLSNSTIRTRIARQFLEVHRLHMGPQRQREMLAMNALEKVLLLCDGVNPRSEQSCMDPRVLRANRERAVATVGPIARELVETHGEEAVAAIFACTKPVAVKLAEFNASGEMRKLPRPRDLLRVIAQPRHGDDVALWAINHVRELTDTDCFDAYLLSPLEYALGLKQLAAGAAEARTRRLSLAAVPAMPAAPPPLLSEEKLVIAGVVGFLVIAGLLLWQRKRSSVA